MKFIDMDLPLDYLSDLAKSSAEKTAMMNKLLQLEIKIQQLAKKNAILEADKKRLSGEIKAEKTAKVSKLSQLEIDVQELTKKNVILEADKKKLTSEIKTASQSLKEEKALATLLKIKIVGMQQGFKLLNKEICKHPQLLNDFDKSNLIIHSHDNSRVILYWFVSEGEYFEKGQNILKTNKDEYSWGLSGIVTKIYKQIGEHIPGGDTPIAEVIVIEH